MPFSKYFTVGRWGGRVFQNILSAVCGTVVPICMGLGPLYLYLSIYQAKCQQFLYTSNGKKSKIANFVLTIKPRNILFSPVCSKSYLEWTIKLFKYTPPHTYFWMIILQITTWYMICMETWLKRIDFMNW